MWKRVAIIVLSSWVLISGNAWPQTRANHLNSTIVGTGLLFFGLLSMRHQWARYVTLAFGAWLFAFTVVAGHISSVTYWNNAMVAAVVFILSLVGGESPRRAVGTH
jgi:hypothetical protein